MHALVSSNSQQPLCHQGDFLEGEALGRGSGFAGQEGLSALDIYFVCLGDSPVLERCWEAQPSAGRGAVCRVSVVTGPSPLVSGPAGGEPPLGKMRRGAP